MLILTEELRKLTETMREIAKRIEIRRVVMQDSSMTPETRIKFCLEEINEWHEKLESAIAGAKVLHDELFELDVDREEKS